MYNYQASRARAVPFIERWLERADSVPSKGAGPMLQEQVAVDRFVGHFIAFNRLYNELWAQENGYMPQDAKKLKKKVQAEPLRATVRVVERVTAPEVLQAMRGGESDNLAALQHQLSQAGGFYLETEDEQPHFEGFEGLTDEDKLARTLHALYTLRCNLFHGEKSLNTQQDHLLAPANACLEVIVRAGLRSLIQWHPPTEP